MGVETHKVEIVPVKLEKHPNADKLSVVKVYNFQVCVNTADWQGVEKAAYVQPDSVMPDTPEYRFLKETSNLRKERDDLWAKLQPDHESDLAREDYNQKLKVLEAKIDANTKHLRITVKKLRGIISMGMLIPAPEGSQVGDDVAEQLGITHYEPPVEHTGDEVAPAPPMIYAPNYDVESVYRYADCFTPGEPVYVSEKIDGQNGRFVTTWGEMRREDTPGGQRRTVSDVNFHAGSRNEWKKEGGSNWWKVLKSDLWLHEWVISNADFVLYGEVFGWVQSLRYGAKPGELFFRAFDVMEGTSYWDAEKFLAEIPEQHRVPSLGIMPFDFEKLQALADGPSLVKGADHMREGIVIKPLVERQHPQLGRVMVKMVSNAYLEKSAR